MSYLVILDKTPRIEEIESADKAIPYITRHIEVRFFDFYDLARGFLYDFLVDSIGELQEKLNDYINALEAIK